MSSCIEIEPSLPATKSIIWLHGLGAEGSDFVPIVSELSLPSSINIRFIFPDAPIMPITVNNGYEMRAWYDIYSLNIDEKIDKTGMLNGTAMVKQFIDQEIARGMATHDIILAGFSQGAVIALLTGLGYSKPLGGIIALSGYLPFADEMLISVGTAEKPPIFLAHGTEDPMVPYSLGLAAYAALQQKNYDVTWHSYAMPHSVCAEEIKDISDWLSR